MKSVTALLVILAMSLENLHAAYNNDVVYNLFKQTIDVQVLTASNIINITSQTLQKIKENTNKDGIASINTTLNAAYTYDKTNQNKNYLDCIAEAQITVDNMIQDATEELVSCTQLTQAFDQVKSIGDPTELQKRLDNTSNAILLDAKNNCKQKDFQSQLSCMQRKANSSNPSLAAITSDITKNMHHIGGLELLMNIEYKACQEEELAKLPKLVQDVKDTVNACV